VNLILCSSLSFYNCGDDKERKKKESKKERKAFFAGSMVSIDCIIHNCPVDG
jgi:hypothetical protein